MKLIIEIPEQMYLNAKADTLCGADILVRAIKNGTPLPKGHGRLIDGDALWKKWVFDAIGKQEIDDAPTIIEADTESEG